MSDVILCSGWLHKKRREARIGPKYQKRWFELTESALAYAKDPNELTATKIEVFNLWDLAWIKRVDQLKLQMKFPERMLIVKAESPGETEKWYTEIEKITKGSKQPPAPAAQEPPPAPSPKKVSQVMTAFTIEADSDSDDERRSSNNNSNRQRRTSRQARKLVLEDDGPSSSRASSSAQRLAPLRLTPPTDHSATSQNRPPSPRSLLANPKLGQQIVSTPTACPPAEESEVLAFQHSSGSGYQDAQLQPSPKKKAKAPAADTQEPADDVHPLELPRPAILNTSLRSNVAIQDEIAPTLIQPTSSSGGSPLNGSLRSSTHANGSINSPLNGSLRGTASPLNASLHGPSSSLNSSLKGGAGVGGGRQGSVHRPHTNPVEEEVVAFEQHEVHSARPSRPQSVQASRTGTENGLQASRRGSAHTLHRPDEERLELDHPHAPSAHSHASRLGSAGSSRGPLGNAARASSAASSTAAAVGGLHGDVAGQLSVQPTADGDWDSSSSEDESPKQRGQTWGDDVMTVAPQRQPQQQAPAHQVVEQQQHKAAPPPANLAPVKPSAPAGGRPGVRQVVAARVVRTAPKPAVPVADIAPVASPVRSPAAPADVMGNSWDDETDDGGSPVAHVTAAKHKQHSSKMKAPATNGGAAKQLTQRGAGVAGVQQDQNWVEEDWDEED